MSIVALDRWAKERERHRQKRNWCEWGDEQFRFKSMASITPHPQRGFTRKREAEAQARREAIERQELIITIVGIIVLLIFTFVEPWRISTTWNGLISEIGLGDTC